MSIYLYTGLLGFLFFIISISTIKGRNRYHVSLGINDSRPMQYLVSAHSNFSSYTPIFLIMLYLIEIKNTNLYLIHILGMTFLLGRILHFITMINNEQKVRFRKLGMHLTLWPLIVSSSLLIYLYIN